jgi:hypothetical protein
VSPDFALMLALFQQGELIPSPVVTFPIDNVGQSPDGASLNPAANAVVPSVSMSARAEAPTVSVRKIFVDKFFIKCVLVITND